jgi:hypothetical protein
MKKQLYLPAIGAALLAFVLFQSCDNDNDNPGPTSVKKWQVPIKAIYEAPAPAGRTEEGDATIELFADNSLKYDIHIHNLSSNDTLKDAHIHVGDPVTSGGIFIRFNPTFTGAGTSGTVTGLRQGQVDSLLNLPCYVNVHSAKVGAGLVRGQLDKTVDFAIDVNMTGANEVPPVTTTATGKALLRLMTDKTLYSKVTVTGLESNDALTVAHIHPGAVGANNPPSVNLCNSVTDFGISKSLALTDAQVTLTKSNPCYVNAHSTLHGPGLIRGQIR